MLQKVSKDSALYFSLKSNCYKLRCKLKYINEHNKCNSKPSKRCSSMRIDSKVILALFIPNYRYHFTDTFKLFNGTEQIAIDDSDIALYIDKNSKFKNTNSVCQI